MALSAARGKGTEQAKVVIRQHSKYNGRTSLVVMPEKYDKALEETEVNVEGSEWVFYLGEESDRLRDLLNLCETVRRSCESPLFKCESFRVYLRASWLG